MSDSAGSGDGSGDEGASPTKGPKRKNIRKVKNLTSVMLKAAAEGRTRDETRKEAVEAAAAEVGTALVLKAPKANGRPETDVTVPEHMSEQLQPHQRVGVSFLWDCCIRNSRGAILAHCMGLGKTFQTITMLQCAWQYLSKERSKKEKFLILAPVNVLRTWESEFDKWLPDPETGSAPPLFTMLEAGNLHRDRAGYLNDWNEEGGIMLMGYEQFRNLVNGKGIRKGKAHAGIAETYQKSLVDPGPYLVVCDEGHILRREQSGLTQAVRKVQTQRRVVLSGTPLQNNLMEYHCMVDFVRPALLGDANQFKKTFVAAILNGQCVDSTEKDVRLMRYRSHILNDTLKTCVDRADFKVLQPYLRRKHEFIIGMRLSGLQVDMYRKILEENAVQFTKDGKGVGKNVGLSVLSTYHKLARVWTHPKVSIMQKARVYDSMDEFIASDSDGTSWSDEEERRKKKARKKAKLAKGKEDEASAEEEDLRSEWMDVYREVLEHLTADATGKMSFLSKLLREAGACGDKVLVFSQSLLVLDLIEDMLSQSKKRGTGIVDARGRVRKWQCGLDYFRLDGSTSSDKRKKDIDKFNLSRKARLYLISTRAGSLGVNLATANRVVIMDASWNPSYDTQAIFRAYRFGQEKECYVYRLLSQGTMEQKIYGRQVTKQALSSRVVDSEETGRHFSSDELAALFEFDPGPTVEQVEAEQRAAQGEATRDDPAQQSNGEAMHHVAATASGGKDGLLPNQPAAAGLGSGSDKSELPGNVLTAPATVVTDQGSAGVGTGKEEEEEGRRRGTLFGVKCLPPKDDVLARVLGAANYA